MKQSKAKDLRALGDAELGAKLKETRDSLFKLRIRKETRQLEDASGLRTLRRDIARIHTLAREKKAAVAAKAGVA
jgi:large subunit ribosomal protein L29